MARTAAASTLLTFSLLAPPSLVVAAEDPAFCRPLQAALPPATSGPNDGKIKVSADSVESIGQNTMLFSGAVKLEQQNQALSAEQVKVSRETGKIEAEGGIEARGNNFFFRSDSALLDSEEKRGSFSDVYYEYFPKHANGNADVILQTENSVELENATYSTCNPGNRDWQLSARSIKLDQELGFGYATLARLTFKGFPLIYLPAITFPITDQRRTGVLYPILGNSDENGFELAVPLYWNIAPNYDLTFKPRYLSKRGTMFGNNFRYLGKDHKGNIAVDYLDNDKQTDEERYLYRFAHNHQVNRHWSVNVDATTVSDGDYFTDFANDLGSFSTTHIERRADLVYNSRHLTGVIRAQNFQTLDETISDDNRPYERVPQINLYGVLPASGEHFSVDMTSDLTRFSHHSLVQGNRLDLAPRLNLTWLTTGAYLKPSAVWHYTRYDLNSDPDRVNNKPDRAIPLLTVDSGLTFDRKTKEGGLQTLEPRLFYLYAPYRDQSNLPVFDTLEPSFVFSSLFRENRFSGLDRIGDANQLTAAVSSRMLDKNGSREILSAGLGQIFYFEDQEVTLPDETASSNTRSDIAAELFYSPSKNWSLRGSLMGDADLTEGKVATFRVHYRSSKNQITNLEHRFHREDDINQTDLSTIWPINNQWRFVARWLYSHESKHDLELLSGLEYESCCWKAVISNRRYIISDEGEYNNSIHLQLILKGLASFGTGNSILEKSIPGYALNDN